LRFRTREIGLIPNHPVDIVFPHQQVVVDVRSCYWHGCPEHSPVVEDAKIRASIARDAINVSHLRRFGWTVIIVWEHEDPDAAARRVAKATRGGDG
jgi:DNA mismatch endonuclease (patch repair protein)